MAKVTVSQVFPAEASKLWALVGAPDSIASWHPAIATSVCGSGGATRVCKLPDGAEVHEEITHHSDAERRYSYRITKSPLPIANYVSTLSVQPEGGGARLVWESEFEAVGAPASEVEKKLRELYEAGMANLASKLS
jgi:mxaD protein